MTTDFSPNADELLSRNGHYADDFDGSGLGVAPSRHLAVVACMDSRMDMFALLGLGNGEAHIIRNAGGVVTDDVIRSLCLSQRSLGTREVILVHHTDCGLTKVTDDGFRADLQADLGVMPAWAVDSFTDPHADVVQSMHRLRNSPFVVHDEHVRGFVYDVDTGSLHEVVEQD